MRWPHTPLGGALSHVSHQERYFTVDVGSHGGTGMLRTVREFFGGETGGDDVHECRRCGTTVETTTATCPSCGNDDIVRHTME